jgi:hypothetical protein
VVFWEMFCDGQTALIYEQHSMTVLVDLHIVTSADPSAVLDLLCLVRVETTGTQWPADFVDVLGQAQDHGFGDALSRVLECSGFFAVFVHENAHSLY